ncbi:unnamed protein product [Meganyctiphanes norvegica]|uniref:C2H2-type domain-containing protein n=1 Tax=Meganyctiphanes norvegica TaxID=48144 RepID=A0AAV2QSZ3_MEGNR
MEVDEDNEFENHFLDLHCEDEDSNVSLNDSGSGDLNKNTYDFSNVRKGLPTTGALGYLAIDKFVLGIILDAKTAAKTGRRAALNALNSASDSWGDNGDKAIWQNKGVSREARNFALSHNLEIKPTISCVKECGFKSSNAKRLKYHEQNCLLDDSEKPYACPECGYRSGIDKDHYDHLMTHVIQTPFKCFYCDKMCNSKGYFREHFVSQHKVRKSFACTMCRFKCSKRTNLHSHIASHTSRKSEACGVCGEKFKDYIGLKVHMNVHTGNNPWKVKRNFTCNLCGQKYKQKAALQRHLYSHEDKQQGESINPLKCSMCLFSCKQGAKLQRHMINCHPESVVNCQMDDSFENRPYACTLCDLRFLQASDLQHHMKNHMQTVGQLNSVSLSTNITF